MRLEMRPTFAPLHLHLSSLSSESKQNRNPQWIRLKLPKPSVLYGHVSASGTLKGAKHGIWASLPLTTRKSDNTFARPHRCFVIGTTMIWDN